MSDARERFRNVLLQNRVALGLVIESEEENSDSSSRSSESILNTVASQQTELTDLLENLSINSNSKMENFRFYSKLLPTFSGNQLHLESFILSIDDFNKAYPASDNETKTLVLAVIKSKLVDNARNFLLSRPDLDDWNSIKNALRQRFGDPITYFVLMQQLQYFRINKNETILQFVERLKTFKQRIISKVQCEVEDVNSRTTLINQVEHTAVLILTANSPETLKAMLMMQRPSSLKAAFDHVVNYNMVENQIKFATNVTTNLNIRTPNNNLTNNNQINRPRQTNLPQTQNRFAQRPFSANTQRPFSANTQRPSAMVTSTAGSSRTQQNPQNRYPNFSQIQRPEPMDVNSINVDSQPVTENQFSDFNQDSQFDAYYSNTDEFYAENSEPSVPNEQTSDSQNTLENSLADFTDFPNQASKNELT